MNKEPVQQDSPARKWAKRAGWVAFLFFLAKGLIWLGILAAGAYFALK